MNVSTLPIKDSTPIETDHYISEIEQYILPEFSSPNGDLNWGRLICTWHQKKSPENIITHTYAPLIDGRNGEIYLDCHPRKIFTKCLAHLISRPFFTIAKTIYHLTLYPIFCEIAKYNKSSLLREEKIKNLLKATADIFLTPLYGLILTVSTAAVLIIGSLSIEYLYEGRKYLGEIERFSNWGNAHTLWTLVDCFQPYPLNILKQYENKEFNHDTSYEDQSRVGRQLSNFARAHVRYKTKNFDFFSCSKLPLNTPYISPIIA